MTICSCDYDPPSFYTSRLVKARKEYRCEECSKPIKLGDRHEYAFGIMDGDWPYQPRTCMSCVEIRRWVKNNIPCFCWAHGNLIEDAKNTIEAAYCEAPDEVRGVAFGFGRLLVKARRERQAAANNCRAGG